LAYWWNGPLRADAKALDRLGEPPGTAGGSGRDRSDTNDEYCITRTCRFLIRDYEAAPGVSLGNSVSSVRAMLDEAGYRSRDAQPDCDIYLNHVNCRFSGGLRGRWVGVSIFADAPESVPESPDGATSVDLSKVEDGIVTSIQLRTGAR
jgi:hypothetical protein